MKNVSERSCRGNQSTHFMFSNVFYKCVPFMRYVEKFISWIVSRCTQTIILCQAMLIRLSKEIHICIYVLFEELQCFEKVNDTMLKLLGSRVFGLFRKTAKSDYQLRHVCLSVRLSAWNNSAPTGRIFVKFGMWRFFETLSKKSFAIKIGQE